MFKLVLLYLGINLIISSLFRLANLSSSILKLSKRSFFNSFLFETGLIVYNLSKKTISIYIFTSTGF